MRRIAPTRGLALAVLLAAGTAGLAAAPARAAAPPVGTAVLAASTEEWSWNAFCKFWKRQFGKTSGVVGIVGLVGIGAVLLIMWKGRGD
jgi:hypothetical protein